MATKKFSDLTTTSTPNSASVFAIAYDSANYGVTLSNIAANLPATTATSLTSSGTLTTSGNATIGGDLTISGDDLFMGTNTSGAALIADGTNFNPVVISGDISIGTTGTAAIGTGVIVNADVNTSAAIAATKIHDGTISNTEFGYLNNVSSNIQTQLDAKASSSYVPTTITIADESSDTTCFPLFVTAATGDLGPKSAAGLTFNSSTDVLSGTFAGNITGNVTGNTSGTSGSTTGNAATATALASARNIGGVSFDGTGNIDLPGVNAAGNQDTSGTAGDATVLETARTIGGVSFNGSANIDLPGVNSAGNQNTSGSAASLSATLAVASGGTNLTSYTAGDVLYASGTTTLAKLAKGSADQVLTMNSGATAPEWAATASTIVYPTISSISPSTITNAATNVTITGTGYVTVPNVEAWSTSGAIINANSVAFTSATTIVANLTLPTDGTYFLRVENPAGLSVRSSSALLTVSDEPTWTTASGSLGEVAAGGTMSFTIAATGDSTLAYTVASGSMPGGASLNSSTGAITGTESGASAETTYSFTARATDAESQTADRAFTIKVTVGMNNSGQFN
jgi:hypothetical protein